MSLYICHCKWSQVERVLVMVQRYACAQNRVQKKTYVLDTVLLRQSAGMAKLSNGQGPSEMAQCLTLLKACVTEIISRVQSGAICRDCASCIIFKKQPHNSLNPLLYNWNRVILHCIVGENDEDQEVTAKCSELCWPIIGEKWDASVRLHVPLQRTMGPAQHWRPSLMLSPKVLLLSLFYTGGQADPSRPLI